MTSEQIHALVQLSEWIGGNRLVFDIPNVGESYISRVNLNTSLFRIYYPLYSVDLQGDIPSNDLPNLRYMYNEYMSNKVLAILFLYQIFMNALKRKLLTKWFVEWLDSEQDTELLDMTKLMIERRTIQVRGPIKVIGFRKT